MNHLCANCWTSTDSLTEHRSEVDPPTVFHPECCPGGCDSLDDDHVDGCSGRDALRR